MCQACIQEKNAALEDRMKIDREAYKNYQKQSAAAESEPVSIPKEEPKMKEVVSTPPATFQSWLFGVLSGGQDSWIMNYMNSEFYETARNAIKERTGGRDIHVAILVCAALNAARVRIPVVLDALLNQVKSQVTSSVIISGYDSRLCRELMKLVLEKSEERRKLRRFRGEHEIRAKGGELQPVGGKTHNSFWHNGTHFTVEIYRPRDPDKKKQKEKEKAENLDDTELFSRDVDVTARLTVRCWGHSREPITALFEDLEKRISESRNLTVVEMQARPGSDKSSFHMKRPLSTIDLDPKMMQDIIDDVELFFHKDSRNWYRNSGRPYRHGYLFAGPPGTGKTSLLIGIASHMNLPLYMINLQGMDDKDLREAFSRIPFRSCVALEDIDCVGVDVSNRGAKKPEPKPVLDPQSSEEASSDDPQVLVLETLITKFMDKQATANSEVLNQVKAIKTATLDYLGEDDPQVDEKKKSKGAAGKTVTLSGLLNVIDGVNATEGRLIIITTNHPEKLDPALYRAGRVERKFEITYASKASSTLTFKRLFDNDVCKRYTSEAIDRFAQAFQAQFPSKSRITTAELSKYCGQYRGRPDIAVKEFSDWLQRGADKFSYPIDYTQLVDEEGIYNVPEPFDEQLLQVSACDLIDPVSAAASGIEVQVAADVQTASKVGILESYQGFGQPACRLW
jgi:chaperone BCS1